MASRYDGFRFPIEEEEEHVKRTGFFSVNSNVLVNLLKFETSLRDEWLRLLSDSERLFVSDTA